MWRQRLFLQSLEARQCLSAISFAPVPFVFEADAPVDIAVADIDLDGNVDVVSATSENQIVWYPNLGDGQYGRKNVVGSRRDANSVFVADVDQDEDHYQDVLVASSAGVSWFENDGRGSFLTGLEISAQTSFARMVLLADMDGDGDQDIVNAISETANHRIVWHENQGGGVFGPTHVVTEDVIGPTAIAVGDIDGDGDLDVVSATPFHDRVAWHENFEDGRFGHLHVVTNEADNTSFVRVGDIDGDEDVDILSSAPGGDGLAWYKNGGEGDNFEEAAKLVSNDSLNDKPVFVGDADGDGDIDVIAASYTNRTIGWYANQGGQGDFVPRAELISDLNLAVGQFGARHIAVDDLDGDGDIDILTSSPSQQFNRPEDGFRWYEGRSIGDSNDDGVFDSGDLVAVFQAGEYEDEIVGNSSFADGDWNGDGDFDTADLVAAFQAGNYVVAATSYYPLIHRSIAAVDWLFATDATRLKNGLLRPSLVVL